MLETDFNQFMEYHNILKRMAWLKMIRPIKKRLAKRDWKG